MSERHFKEDIAALVRFSKWLKVTTNSDLNEGSGRVVTLGYYAESDHALAAAKGKGVQGQDADITEESGHYVSVTTVDPSRFFIVGPEITVFATGAEFAREREVALAKLTRRDREVLGLK